MFAHRLRLGSLDATKVTMTVVLGEHRVRLFLKRDRARPDIIAAIDAPDAVGITVEQGWPPAPVAAPAVMAVDEVEAILRPNRRILSLTPRG